MIQLFNKPRNLGPPICIICGKTEGGSVLKNRKIRRRFEMKDAANWYLCTEHEKLHQEGFIALVEAVQPSHTLAEDGTVTEGGDPHRTGKVIHVRFELAEQLFQTRIDRSLPLVWCHPDVGKRLEAMQREAAIVADEKSS